MHYRELPPPPPLAHLIECVWTLTDANPSPEPRRVLADGCIELLAHRGAPPLARFSGQEATREPALVVVGQLSGPLDLVPTGALDVVGIRFRPGGAAPLLGGLPLARLRDRAVDASALTPTLARLVAAWASDHQANEPPDVSALAKILVPRRDHQPRPLAPAITLALRHRGALSVDRLAAAASLSPRQLERRFDHEVGLGPKAFCRLLRLQHLLARVQRSGRAGWVDHAFACGYADQAHLAREVRALTGTTPSRLLDLDHRPVPPLLGCFASPRRLERFFAD